MDDDVRALERALEAGEDALLRRRLQLAYARLGRGWWGETLPNGVVLDAQPGEYFWSPRQAETPLMSPRLIDEDPHIPMVLVRTGGVITQGGVAIPLQFWITRDPMSFLVCRACAPEDRIEPRAAAEKTESAVSGWSTARRVCQRLGFRLPSTGEWLAAHATSAIAFDFPEWAFDRFFPVLPPNHSCSRPDCEICNVKKRLKAEARRSTGSQDPGVPPGSNFRAEFRGVYAAYKNTMVTSLSLGTQAFLEPPAS